MSALNEILQTIWRAPVKDGGPQCIFVDARLYMEAFDELKETDLAKERGVLCADIPFPNFLLGGIPVIPC